MSTGGRINLIDAIVRYDQAQFRLWVSLGSPPVVETSTPDQPPVPEYLVP